MPCVHCFRKSFSQMKYKQWTSWSFAYSINHTQSSKLLFFLNSCNWEETQMLFWTTLWLRLTFHFHAMLVRWFGAYTSGQRLGLCSTSQSTEWNWKETWCRGWEGGKVKVFYHSVFWVHVIIPFPMWLLQ